MLIQPCWPRIEKANCWSLPHQSPVLREIFIVLLETFVRDKLNNTSLDYCRDLFWSYHGITKSLFAYTYGITHSLNKSYNKRNQIHHSNATYISGGSEYRQQQFTEPFIVMLINLISSPMLLSYWQSVNS